LWLRSLKVAQLLRSAACLHTNQSRSYLNHLVLHFITLHYTHMCFCISHYWDVVFVGWSICLHVGRSVCTSVCRIFWLLSAHAVTPFLFHPNLEFVNNSIEHSSAWEYSSSYASWDIHRIDPIHTQARRYCLGDRPSYLRILFSEIIWPPAMQ